MAKVNPRKALPTSPRKTCAGGQLWPRNPRLLEPTSTPRVPTRGLSPSYPRTAQPRLAVTA